MCSEWTRQHRQACPSVFLTPPTQACVVPPLLQNMMGLSEVARATQTPDLSIQQHHSPRLPPCHGASLAAGPKEGPSQHGASHWPPSQRRLGRQCSLGLWAGLLPHQQPLPGHSPQASSPPPQRSCGRQPLLSVGPWGTEPYTSPCGRPFSALRRLHFRKSRTLNPNCLLPAPPPWAEVGPQQPRWVRSRWSVPFLPLSLGHLGAQLWKHHPATPLS